MVYIRPDSSRVQSPSLSLSHPRSGPSRSFFVSSFVPVLYNSDLTQRGAPSPRTPVVSISRTRYSLDRYASRLSLFCLSNIHSTAMWVRIGRLLCSCSRSRGCNAATIRYSATAVTLIAIILLRLSYLCRDISGVLNVSCLNLKHRSESQYSFLSFSFCTEMCILVKRHSFFLQNLFINVN